MRLKKILSLLICAALVLGAGFAQLKTGFAQEDPAYEENGPSETMPVSEGSPLTLGEDSSPEAEGSPQEVLDSAGGENLRESSEQEEAQASQEYPAQEIGEVSLSEDESEGMQSSSEESEEQSSDEGNAQASAGSEEPEEAQNGQKETAEELQEGSGGEEGAGDETLQEDPEQGNPQQEESEEAGEDTEPSSEGAEGNEAQSPAEENTEPQGASDDSEEENHDDPQGGEGAGDEILQEDPQQEGSELPEEPELPIVEDNGVFDPEPEDGLCEAEEEVDPAWEYSSTWDGYEESRSEGNLPAAEQAYALSRNLISQLDTVSSLLASDGAFVNDASDNFADIFAVYAVISGQTENYPYGVGIEKSDFASVFWRMVRVTGATGENGAIVNVRRLSAAEAAEFYNFSERDKALLDVLMERAGSVRTIVEDSVFSHLSDVELERIYHMLPGGISAERRAVLMAALSIEGKVDYFWGGKSLACGWDDRWGEMRAVSNMGSESYGTYRPFGLDASGFASWAFNNAFGGGVGSLSLANWKDASDPAEWKDALPGDIVFTAGHMGIVLTVTANGPASIIHCSLDGVNITDDVSLFDHIARPVIYAEPVPLYTPSEEFQEGETDINELSLQEETLPENSGEDHSALSEEDTEEIPYIKPDEEDGTDVESSGPENIPAKPYTDPDEDEGAESEASGQDEMQAKPYIKPDGPEDIPAKPYTGPDEESTETEIPKQEEISAKPYIKPDEQEGIQEDPGTPRL